ncbi:serine/threonine-protein phosphatase [Methanoculleus sp. FWC-SCC1]|uniref:Serine/threonine-protein phosphatase n=2 Tax=Methanoculleus frigidifontis TaxID=2584085 RepID=A0ABT8M7S6_9EURY|nr:serine/threonine-protein phosphatase [Methanoculleus sp. FWC-SCC1]
MAEVTPLPAVTHASISDRGTRARNEDALVTGWVARYHLFAVADGLGGHARGNVASATAISALRETLELALPQTEPLAALSMGFRRANEAIHRYNRQHGLNAGTTLVAALLDENGVCSIGSVGDSRAYVITETALWRTKDHSPVQELVDAGLLSPEEALAHPQKNVLTRALGLAGSVQADTYEKDLQNAVLLLSSDGLHDAVSERLLQEIALGYDPAEACRRLVAAAKSAGSSDNITVVVARRSGD